MDTKEMIDALREDFKKHLPMSDEEMKYITLRSDKKGN